MADEIRVEASRATFFQVIWKRKGWILLITLLAAGLGYLASLGLPPRYEAVSRLILLGKTGANPAIPMSDVRDIATMPDMARQTLNLVNQEISAVQAVASPTGGSPSENAAAIIDQFRQSQNPAVRQVTVEEVEALLALRPAEEKNLTAKMVAGWLKPNAPKDRGRRDGEEASVILPIMAVSNSKVLSAVVANAAARALAERHMQLLYPNGASPENAEHFSILSLASPADVKSLSMSPAAFIIVMTLIGFVCALAIAPLLPAKAPVKKQAKVATASPSEAAAAAMARKAAERRDRKHTPPTVKFAEKRPEKPAPGKPIVIPPKKDEKPEPVVAMADRPEAIVTKHEERFEKDFKKPRRAEGKSFGDRLEEEQELSAKKRFQKVFVRSVESDREPGVTTILPSEEGMERLAQESLEDEAGGEEMAASAAEKAISQPGKSHVVLPEEEETVEQAATEIEHEAEIEHVKKEPRVRKVVVPRRSEKPKPLVIEPEQDLVGESQEIAEKEAAIAKAPESEPEIKPESPEIKPEMRRGPELKREVVHPTLKILGDEAPAQVQHVVQAAVEAPKVIIASAAAIEIEPPAPARVLHILGAEPVEASEVPEPAEPAEVPETEARSEDLAEILPDAKSVPEPKPDIKAEADEKEAPELWDQPESRVEEAIEGKDDSEPEKGN